MNKWAKGCLGCGCAGVLIAGAFVGGSALWVGNMVGSFDDAVSTDEVLESNYGSADDYVPPHEPSLDVERIERFLQVRAATDEARRAVLDFTDMLDPEKLESLEDEDGWQQLKQGLGIVKGSVGFGQDIAKFFSARNAALVEQGMGMGEYTFLYSLIYGSWLGHSFDAQLNGEMEDVPFGDQDTAVEMERRFEGMLTRQLDSLPLEADPEWRATLEAEAALLAERDARFPFESGIPEPYAAVLEPFRAQLEATFAPQLVGLELGRPEKRGEFSYSADF